MAAANSGSAGKGKTMTTLREAAQAALNVLDAGFAVTPDDAYHNALRAALAQPDEQAQPVAWRWSESGGDRWFDWTTDWSHHERALDLGYLVEYAAPVDQPVRVPMTDNEISNLVDLYAYKWEDGVDDWATQIVRVVERAHGIV